MKRRQVVTGAGALALSLTAARRASAADEIRIGMLSPMTGATAKFGLAHKNALTLAVEDVNAAGGIASLGGAKIRLIVGDHRGDADTGATETERLIAAEKVVAVVGAFQSAICMPASAVAERFQVPWLNFGTVDTITERGFHYTFRAHATDSIKARTIVDSIGAFSKGHPPLQHAVIFAENTDWGKSVSSKQKAQLEKIGTKVDLVDTYPFASPDMTSMIVRAQARSPDLVISDSYLGDALLITRTMQEQDLKPVMFATGGGGYVQPDYLKGVGPLADGVISCVGWDAGVGGAIPWIGELNARHIARFGAPFTEDSACYFQAFYVAIDALNRMSGPVTGPRLRDAIAATKITDKNNRAMIVPCDQISFDDKGQNPYANAFVVQWQSGALKLFYPQQFAAQTKLLWPYPQAS